MKTIAILSQKGGTGKTTIAVHIAVAAERDGITTAVIDLDPQASASAWKDLRDGDTPTVISAQASRLTQILNAARDAGAGLVILDTAPHSESAALAAARISDFVLIPCRPAIFDLRAIANTIDIVGIAKKPAAILFNAAPPRGNATEQAQEALKDSGVPICPHILSQRAPFYQALIAGQSAQEYDPHGKAAEEVANLYQWLCEKVIK